MASPTRVVRAQRGAAGDAGRDEEAIRVRLLANWCDSRTACEIFNRMSTDGRYEWRFEDALGAPRRVRVTWDDDEEPDYWAVLNAPPPGDRTPFDPARTVVFHMEPLMWTDAMRSQWGAWASPSRLSFLQVRDHRRYRNSCDWWLGSTYEELCAGPPPAKDKTLAACVSEKYFDPGHRKRVDFLHDLDATDLDLDIYGAESHGFRRWRSRLPAHDKRACLLPYRYYFDAENNATPNFYTEKIVDCLLAETLCFYWGCPNLDSFFDPRAFVRLELVDAAADVQRVRDAIAADEWQARLPFIRAEKQRILHDYQFFPTLARVVDPARRSRHWRVGPGDTGISDRWIGDRRAGTFVEVSERREAPAWSETLDAERRLDWTGVCVEADSARADAARAVRDCIVVKDSHERLEWLLARNAVRPRAIDWLNLAVAAPSALLAPGGRLDAARVQANLISMPLASEVEWQRCAETLGSLGYERPAGSPTSVLVRRGRDDVYGFYHLCTINHWRDVLAEQAKAWETSGLLDATARVIVSVVGPDADEASVLLDYLLGEKLSVVHRSADVSGFERPILEYARRFCEHEEPLARAVWYMHGKGVSPEHCDNPHVADWRRLMQYFGCGGWRRCLAALEDHDACGVNWHAAPAPHFSGNFWWATPRYVGTLPTTIGPAPFDPEAWVGTNQPRVTCLHESGVDHYLTPYPADRYQDATHAFAAP
ncbi:MAG TPA: glycosyltransferase family 10 [Acidimicrobiia bacterium]|nr:glycosyltransferase family 10 [Acidimicrobiia bacterium]